MSKVYNPNEENGNEEQVYASRWELLRRNKMFREIAEQWRWSRTFRLAHAASADYHNRKVHFPRCALDWMISPSERKEVALAQLERERLFKDPRFNFGPINCKCLVSPLEVVRRKTRGCFRIEAISLHTTVNVDDTWRDAPNGFKTQFRFAVKSVASFSDVQPFLQNAGQNLCRIANRLATGGLSADATGEIAENLLRLGEWLGDLTEFHCVFALPNSTYTPASLKEHFARIRACFEELGQFDARSRYARRKNFLGSTEDWKWFLTAEELGLDRCKSKDLYRLANIYTTDLRPRPGNRATGLIPIMPANWTGSYTIGNFIVGFVRSGFLEEVLTSAELSKLKEKPFHDRVECITERLRETDCAAPNTADRWQALLRPCVPRQKFRTGRKRRGAHHIAEGSRKLLVQVAFEVEFETGILFLEPHATTRAIPHELPSPKRAGTLVRTVTVSTTHPFGPDFKGERVRCNRPMPCDVAVTRR